MNTKTFNRRFDATENIVIMTLAKTLFQCNLMGHQWADSRFVFGTVERALRAAFAVKLDAEEVEALMSDMYSSGELFGVYVQNG